MNDVRLQVSGHTVYDNPVVGYVSWNNCGKNMHAICGHLESLGFQMVNFCSIGYFEAMIAKGELAGTIFPQQKPMAFHDTAPGHLLVEEAGGIVTDLYGLPQDYLQETFRGHVMANSPGIHSILLCAIEKYGDVE
jgi:fructose-1,6-bisphosphatase/inositol monophosphatase family enzyme